MRTEYLASLLVLLGALTGRAGWKYYRVDQASRRLFDATPETLNPRALNPRPLNPRTNRIVVGSIGMAILGWWTLGVVGVILALGVASGAGAWWKRSAGARLEAAVERDLPLALETIARILRSGTSPMLALNEAAAALNGPIKIDLERLAASAERFGLRAAIESWGSWRPSAALASRAIIVALDAGRGAGDGIDAVALTLRERHGVDREVCALASQARLSAVVMAATPVGFALLLSGSDPAARQFLLHSPIGLACLGIGITMDVAGYQWMRSIARVIV